MTATNFARNKILDYNFGSVTYSVPAVLYAGLSTTSISTSGSNSSEPLGSTGYARVPITNDKSKFSYASSGCLVVSGSLAFPVSSGSQGIVVDFALWDALTSGSIWYFTTLASPRVVDTLTELFFSASAITISVT